jgi:hypothetical protein
MVTVNIAGDIATIDGYEWQSDNESLQELLNAMLHPSGPSGADPYPDLTRCGSRHCQAGRGSDARRRSGIRGRAYLLMDYPAQRRPSESLQCPSG